MKTMYVYILANDARFLYTGVTNDLRRRLSEHRGGHIATFTSRFRIHRLVYFEAIDGPRRAIRREKQIKNWKRYQRVALVESRNPDWEDLAADWIVA